MGQISITKIEVRKQIVKLYYEVSEDLRPYFRGGDCYELEYDVDVDQVPESLLVLPLVCNVLPVIWLTDSTLIINSIDRCFFESLDQVKAGYIQMYPMLEFKGRIQVGQIVENQTSGNKSIALFSGGVDAYSTLISHLDESPILFTIWGSDVKRTDIEGWNNIWKLTDVACQEYGLDKAFVKSNFRELVDEDRLTEIVKGSGEGWWHGFQHGIAIVSHTIPLAYVFGAKNVYMASTYCYKNKNYTCASDPTIEGMMRFATSSVIHDRYDLNRQDKLELLCKFHNETGKKIPLHVCWITTNGENCCSCEKCYRTMMGILAEGANPQIYGFSYGNGKIAQIGLDIKYTIKISQPNIFFWKDIQNRFKENVPYMSAPKELRWIYNFNFDKVNEKPSGLRMQIHLVADKFLKCLGIR